VVPHRGTESSAAGCRTTALTPIFARFLLPRASITSASTPDFTSRVAIIIGAARGLGLAAAKRLHERGASVAVNVRDEARAQSVARRATGASSTFRQQRDERSARWAARTTQHRKLEYPD